MEKYEEGIRELKKTLQPEDENTPRYMYALGAAFARSGDHQNGLRYIRQARDGAAALGQFGLVASIDRDLRTLESPRPPQGIRRIATLSDSHQEKSITAFLDGVASCRCCPWALLYV